MIYVRWTLFLVFWSTVAGFLLYTLPRQDVIRVTGIETKLQNVSSYPIFWATGDVAAPQTAQRDVFFVYGVTPDGETKVYRNEDTGWGWPPFFKFDSGDDQADFAAVVSEANDPRWVSLRHYGWRMVIFSSYPNTLSVQEVASPDVRIIPWMNIVILLSLAAIYWALRVRWVRFRRNRLDPVLKSVEDWFAGISHRWRN